MEFYNIFNIFTVVVHLYVCACILNSLLSTINIINVIYASDELEFLTAMAWHQKVLTSCITYSYLELITGISSKYDFAFRCYQ